MRKYTPFFRRRIAHSIDAPGCAVLAGGEKSNISRCRKEKLHSFLINRAAAIAFAREKGPGGKASPGQPQPASQSPAERAAIFQFPKENKRTAASFGRATADTSAGAQSAQRRPWRGGAARQLRRSLIS